jgi:hypothetical protein
VYCILCRLSISRRGAYARLRQQNATTVKYSTSKAFVPGLSVSTYSDNWLNARGDVEFVVFPSSEPYSFTHDPEVIRCVTSCLEICPGPDRLSTFRYIQTTMMNSLQEEDNR